MPKLLNVRLTERKSANSNSDLWRKQSFFSFSYINIKRFTAKKKEKITQERICERNLNTIY